MERAEDFKYTGTDMLVSTEETLAHYNDWIVGMFVKLFRQGGARTVLDFGAGVGSLAVLFRKHTGVAPATIEIDPEQRQVLAQRGFSPATSIDEVPAGMDLIYTSNVLEHIPDDVQALRELREKLSPEGRIAIYVPAFESIWTSLDDKVGHQRRYTKRTLTAHLEQAGFAVEKIGYRDSIGFLLALLFRFIGNSEGEPGRLSLILFDRVLLPVSRALDLIASPFFGKNVYAIARLR